MKTLPITMLFHEGPIARAYLSCLNQAGYTIDEIIYVIYTIHPSTKRKIGWWLPKVIRIKYLKKVQEIMLNYWPKNIANDYLLLFKTIYENLVQVYPIAATIIEDIVNPKPIMNYSNNIKYVMAESLNDKGIGALLAVANNHLVLFTGGGILKKNILNISKKRYLHIHPGYLPYIKGADGLLWSTLLRKKPSASAFFMEEIIDAGNIIYRKEYNHIEFKIPNKSRPNNKTLYRAIFSYYDPIIRAELLLELFKGYRVDNLPEIKQRNNEGDRYGFMDEATLDRALGILFPNY